MEASTLFLHGRGNVVAYYEIAATPIPLLIFGGVVTERWLPPEGVELVRLLELLRNGT